MAGLELQPKRLRLVILSNCGGAGHSGRNWWASLVTVVLVFD